jgi:thiopurine S-methyltransferase
MDIKWLFDQGFQVSGVEISPVACASFFEEYGLEFTVQKSDGFVQYSSPSITLWCGDFFSIRPAVLGHIDAVYDRAALIAIEPATREQYCLKIKELCPKNLLLIGIDFPANEVKGPPFPLTEDEVTKLYGDTYSIKHLHKAPETRMPTILEKFANIAWIDEYVFCLTAK